MKLFWKEVREDIQPVSAGKMIWDELPATVVDTQKLEHLFESRAKDMMSKVYCPRRPFTPITFAILVYIDNTIVYL